MRSIRKTAQGIIVALVTGFTAIGGTSNASPMNPAVDANGSHAPPYRMVVYKLANGHEQLNDRVAKSMPGFDDHMPPAVMHVIMGTNVYAPSRLPYVAVSLDRKPFLVFDKRPGSTIVLIANRWNELGGRHSIAQPDSSTLIVKDKTGAEVLRIHSINEFNVSVKGALEFGGVRTRITEDEVIGANVIERSSYLGNQVINLTSAGEPAAKTH